MSIRNDQSMTTKNDIQELISSLARLELKKKYLNELILSRKDMVRQIGFLERNVEKELADVIKIEKASFKSILSRIKGIHKHKIEKEREEYIQAALKLKECAERLDLLDFEISVIKSKIDNIRSLNSRLTWLLKKRNDELVASSSLHAEKLIALNTEQDYLRRYKTEIKEVLGAIKSYQNDLFIIIKDIESAAFWSSKYDLISDAKMRDHLNRAFANYSTCEISFVKLQTELKDIEPDVDVVPRLDVDIFVYQLGRGDIDERIILSSLSQFKNAVAISKNIEQIVQNKRKQINLKYESNKKELKDILLNN